MRLLRAEDVDALLTFPTLIEALREAFRSATFSPKRHHHALAESGSVHLLMPAWTESVGAAGSFLGTKIVNVFPANGRLGLPAVLGAYVLQSGETGAPLAVIDGTRLTHWRTAAASALASSYLARSDARRLLMVGAGALAPFLVQAHAAVRGIEDVLIWNRSRAGAERTAAILGGRGWSVAVADDLEGAVRSADIISCATLSTVPLVKGAWLPPGVHLDLVGAFTMGMREADDEALHRSALFVDTEAALSEGGDVAIALGGGALDRDHVRATLGDLCRGTHPGRSIAHEITAFKSVGASIEDLAAAMLVWRAADADRSRGP